jgi:LacI family transcriptional regulator
MDVICAIEAACGALGQMVFLANTKDDPDFELEVVKSLYNRRVDGIILAPSADPDKKAISYLKDMRVPCVLVDRLVSSEFDQVGIENEGAMDLLVDHLADLGHTHIALIAGQPNFTTTLERLQGFRNAMQRRGLPVVEDFIYPGNQTVAAAADSTRKLLSLPTRPTAIATGNNLATIGVMQALHEVGIRAPDDIALVGFDDFEWADSFEPRLTVVAQPCAEIGHSAATLLSERIREINGPRKTVRLKCKLIIRDSCGARKTRGVYS